MKQISIKLFAAIYMRASASCITPNTSNWWWHWLFLVHSTGFPSVAWLCFLNLLLPIIHLY